MLARSQGKWIERSQAEEDESWRQVIPYCLVVFDYIPPMIFSYKRLGGSEERLEGMCSIGIGGHVELEDRSKGSPVLDAAHREIREELVVPEGYHLDVDPCPVMSIALDDTPVDRVHVGIVYLATIFDSKGPIRKVEPRESCISGEMITTKRAKEQIDRYEPWSKYILERMSSEAKSP